MKSKPNKKRKGEIIPRLLMLFFLIIACVQAISSVFLFSSPEFALAQDIDYTYQVPIEEDKTNLTFGEKSTTEPIANYITVIYKYAIGAVGILAAVMLMVGGLVWLTAGGNTSRVGTAKDFIASSLTGLVLVFCSYLILSQINPDLVNFTITDIETVGKAEETGFAITNYPAYRDCKWTDTSFINPYDKIRSEGNCKDKEGIGGKGCNIDKYNYSDADKPYIKCCCDNFTTNDWDQWGYQAGIEEQKKHASPNLQNLLGCLRVNLPNTIGQISSISDSAIVKNDWDYCKAKWNKDNCAHSENSCHYGGSRENNVKQSFAVDFGDEQNWSQIEKVLKNNCSRYYKYAAIEGDHVHISASGCEQKY